MADTTRDKALALAIDLLTRQVADLPVAIAMNAGKSLEDVLERQHVRGKSDLDHSGFGRDEGFGGNRVQAGNADLAGGGGNPFWARQMERAGKAAAAGVGAVGGAFSKLLGPLSHMTGYLTSATSGFNTFSAAMGLWQSTVGVLVAPVLFTLSTGLVAASDSVWKKLQPSLDSFTKAVLSTGVPAVMQFAEVAGRATEALKWLADSKLGGAMLSGAGGGGPLGALNRLTGGESGFASDGTTTGELKRAHRAGDDLIRLLPGGETAAGAKNWLQKNVIGSLIGDPSAVDPYSGKGVTRTGGPPGADKASADTLREMMLQYGSKGSVGDLRGSFRSAQLAALNMTPFQQRTLQMMQEMLQALQAGTTPADEPPAGVYTDGGGGGRVTVDDVLGELGRRLRG